MSKLKTRISEVVMKNREVELRLTVEELEYLQEAMIEAEIFSPLLKEKKEGKKYSFDGYNDLYSKLALAAWVKVPD